MIERVAGGRCRRISLFTPVTRAHVEGEWQITAEMRHPPPVDNRSVVAGMTIATLATVSTAPSFAARAEPKAHLIAIDIGRTGAVAFFDCVGALLAIEDLPVLADGPAGRPTVNAILLSGLVRRWAPRRAVCEHVSARPGEAPSGAFAFGRSRGVIEGVLGAEGIPTRFVTPASWKRRVGIPPGRDMKDMARSVAIARWPEHADLFARAKDHDRAEAALIGLAFNIGGNS